MTNCTCGSGTRGTCYCDEFSQIDETINYPTITKGNIDTWNMITYEFIINGMIKRYPDKKYGELMGMAQNLTNTLFNALKTNNKIQSILDKTIEEDGFIEPEMGLLEIEKILKSGILND